jgi:type VI secretion system VasD/TssJ family lipoprotein
MMRVLALAALLSCPGQAAKAPSACVPQTVSVRLLGSERLNTTPAGDARPLVVRVYHLKSDAKLDRVAFDQLWHDDKTLLGPDLVKVDEVQLFPGARADVEFAREPDVHALVVVGLFQSPRGRTWLYTADLPSLPDAGKCTPGDCLPDDDECRMRANPKLTLPVYLDDVTVDDGSDRLADFPEVGRRQTKVDGAAKGIAR